MLPFSPGEGFAFGSYGQEEVGGSRKQAVTPDVPFIDSKGQKNSSGKRKAALEQPEQET